MQIHLSDLQTLLKSPIYPVMFCCLEKFCFSDILNQIKYLVSGGHKDEVIGASYFPISFLMFSQHVSCLSTVTCLLLVPQLLCATPLSLNCSFASTAKF